MYIITCVYTINIIEYNMQMYNVIIQYNMLYIIHVCLCMCIQITVVCGIDTHYDGNAQKHEIHM